MLQAPPKAGKRGFANCVMLDMRGNVAKLAIVNIFIAMGGACEGSRR